MMEIDVSGVITEIINTVINDLLIGEQKDAKTRAAMRRVLEAFNRQGVSSPVVMKALLAWAKEEA